MNSKVPSSSMIRDCIVEHHPGNILSLKKKYRRKMSSTALCSLVTQRVWKIRFFWRVHTSAWHASDLGTSPAVSSGAFRTGPVRQQEHHALPEDRWAGRSIPPQKIRTLGVGMLATFCSRVEKRKWLVDFYLSQSKETFSSNQFLILGRAFPEERVSHR